MINLVFDTETTGLLTCSAAGISQQPHVVEFSGSLVKDDGTIIETLDFLCKPPHRIDTVITNITRITNALLDICPPFSEYADRVQLFLDKADRVIAHNLSFDIEMIDNEFRRIGSEGGAFWPDIRVCTVEATEYYFGYRMKLAALYRHLFGEDFAEAHRARTDTDALVRVVVELIKRGDI